MGNRELVWGSFTSFFHAQKCKTFSFLVNFVQGQPEFLGGSRLGEMISQKVFPREPAACLLKYFTFNDSKARNNLLSQEQGHQMLNFQSVEFVFCIKKTGIRISKLNQKCTLILKKNHLNANFIVQLSAFSISNPITYLLLAQRITLYLPPLPSPNFSARGQF